LSTTPAAIPLDADGDGLLDPFTDGVLIARHLFGFTGEILADNAVGEFCNRCEGSDVTQYLSGLGMVLDIDGDLTLRPLTDGILVLRHLVGFAEEALVSGAVDEDCMRCDAPTITNYLQSID
jgi:hypothetical protein